MKHLMTAAIAALTLGVTGAANATVIFNDFGPGDTFSMTSGRVVSSGSNPMDPSRNSPGYSFVAGATASVSQIDIVFNSIAGTVNVGLYTVVPYTGPGHGLPGFGTIQPGAALGSWTVTDTGSQVVESITGITGITLTAGTEYFMQLSIDPTATQDAAWGDNSTGVTSTLSQCGDSDPTCAFGNVSLADVTTGAFDVLRAASGVPEPASLFLLGAALGGLGVVRRRRHRRVRRSSSIA